MPRRRSKRPPVSWAVDPTGQYFAGFDPGYSVAVGWAVLEAGTGDPVAVGCWDLPPGAGVNDRMLALYREFMNWPFRTYLVGAAIESQYVGVNPRSGLAVAEAKGWLRAWLVCQEGVPVVEVTPAEGKMALTGNGQATKDDMVHVATLELRNAGIIDLAAGYSKTFKEQAADAYGLALFGRSVTQLQALASYAGG